MTVTNDPPTLVSSIPDFKIPHEKSQLIPLSSYFTDPNVDEMKMSADYKLNSGSSIGIPSGIFTFSNPFEINVVSTSVSDTGTYTVNLKVEDTEPLAITSSFTVQITNNAPK